MTLAQYIWKRIVEDQVELCRTRALHSASNLYVNEKDVQKYIDEYENIYILELKLNELF